MGIIKGVVHLKKSKMSMSLLELFLHFFYCVCIVFSWAQIRNSSNMVL